MGKGLVRGCPWTTLGEPGRLLGGDASEPDLNMMMRRRRRNSVPDERKGGRGPFMGKGSTVLLRWGISVPLGGGGGGRCPIWRHLEISLIDPFERMSDWHFIAIDQG